MHTIVRHSERNVLISERFQGRLWNEMFPGSEYTAREAAKQVAERPFLRFTIREGNRYHVGKPRVGAEMIEPER